jgi:hypothetical protein
MPDTHDADAANRMYWEGDESVADIAARFDFSRRALYDVVRPLPAGVPCDACGGDLSFENRLARKSGAATCAACGAVFNGIQSLVRAGTQQRNVPDGMARDRTMPSARDDMRGGAIRQRAVLLSGAAIAGIAIGGVAAWLARRRE